MTDPVYMFFEKKHLPPLDKENRGYKAVFRQGVEKA